MRYTAIIITAIVLFAAAGTGLCSVVPPTTNAQQLPYVYTQWEHYTVDTGLANDHIFAIKNDGPRMWVGTEDGLACIDKATGNIKQWNKSDGLPWHVISSLDVSEKTGDLWIGLLGGGIARLSGGRFDHWDQFNSGIVNDVVYGVAVQDDNIWVATTAGASRYNTISGEWTIYTEKNAPMEEIWNYGISCSDKRVYIAIWGSGVLEFDIATENWKDYRDPDGEMEIDLYRDDGLVHMVTTGVSYVEDILWVTTYFGANRYDGRYWRGFYAGETGLPSDFGNAVKGRTANEAWFASDKGLGVVADFPSDTWVTYTTDPNTHQGRAVVTTDRKVLEVVETPRGIPHNHTLCVEFDGSDVWIGTAKGLARAVGVGYYKGLKSTAPGSRSSASESQPKSEYPSPKR